MPEKTIPSNPLGATARWTAAARAVESARPDRLFDDPWAGALAGAEGAAWAANRPADSLAPMLLRIRYFDDFLQRVTAGPVVRQVVLMAAGLDTRCFRLNWPAGTQAFELDQPAVLQEKERILLAAGARAGCTRRIVPADLTQPWKQALVEAGFDPHQPSAWLLEGFLFYLPNQNILKILEDVSNCSVPGSWLGFDIINPCTLTSPYTHQWIEMQAQSGAPWIGSLDDPVGLLAKSGWKASLSQAGAAEANHGRWHLPVLPVGMPAVPHNWFVTAQKES